MKVAVGMVAGDGEELGSGGDISSPCEGELLLRGVCRSDSVRIGSTLCRFVLTVRCAYNANVVHMSLGISAISPQRFTLQMSYRTRGTPHAPLH